MKKIAIIGGTGRVGKIVIEQALNQGYSLNVLARDPSKVKSDTRITVIEGSATDKEALDKLLEGTSAIVSTLGPSGINDGVSAAKKLFTEHTSTISTTKIIPLLTKHGIDRFILCGGASLKHPDDKNNWLMRFLLTKVAHRILGDIALDRQNELQILAEHGVNYTIARAGKMDDKVSKNSIKTSSSKFQGGTISTTSLAKFLLDQIDDTRFIGKAVYTAT